jgi:hypothetical protein
MRKRLTDFAETFRVLIIASLLFLAMSSPVFAASPPALSLDGYGVVVLKMDSGNQYDVIISVTDLDGIAPDGSSHTVKMKTPAGVIYPLYHDASKSNTTTALYRNLIDLDSDPEQGDFTFEVAEPSDPSNIKASIKDNLTVNSLDVPKATSFLPVAGTQVVDTTPIFTWAAVPGADDYIVRIYSGDDSQTVWEGSPVRETSYTVPPGVLSSNTAYRYRIAARKADGSDPFDIDYVSVAPDESTPSILFTTGARTDKPSIWIGEGVSTYRSDISLGGVHETRLKFYVHIYDAQGVPGNIRSVRVRFPVSGREERLYYDNGNADNTSIRGVYTSAPDLEPEEGLYTFVVEDRTGNTFEKTEELTVDPIGYPASTSLQPQLNAVMTDTSVDFDWGDVSGAAYYRLRVYDANFNLVLTRDTKGNSYSLPAGFLNDASLYRYDITAYREYDTDGIDNFSVTKWGNSDMPTFMTGSAVAGTSSPTIDSNYLGVYIDCMADPRTPGAYIYALNFDVLVSDTDGVPANIASVKVTKGSTTWDLRLDSIVSSTQAYYYTRAIMDLASIEAGDYTFTVTDRGGRTATVADTLNKNPILPPSNLSPTLSDGLTGTRPTITWDLVPGAAHYTVSIYDGWNGFVYGSGVLSESANSFKVPARKLQANATYSYTVFAYGEYYEEDLDNRSISDYRSATERTHFATSPQGDVCGNGGLLGLDDAIAALQVMARMKPTVYKDADVNGDGKIGLPEAIYILQTLAGLR